MLTKPGTARIVLDLDVVTLAFWDKKDEAGIIEKVKTGFLRMVTPYIILEHLAAWKHRALAMSIAEFYEAYSEVIVTAQNLIDKLNSLGMEYFQLLAEISGRGVKEEDVILVILAGLYEVDFLMTFNKKHLRSKHKEINEVLGKHGIKPIRIIEPKEL